MDTFWLRMILKVKFCVKGEYLHSASAPRNKSESEKIQTSSRLQALEMYYFEPHNLQQWNNIQTFEPFL